MTTPFDIDGLLSHVDFERIQKVMVALDWKYRGTGVPDLEMLYETATSVLQSLEKEPLISAVSCGGFRAFRYPDGPYGIEFLIDDVDSTWLEEEADPAHEQSEAT